MTQGDRRIVRRYLADHLEEPGTIEIRNGRVFSVVKEDLGDLETIIQEAWAWCFAGPEPEDIHL